MEYNFNRPDFPLKYRSGDDTPPSLPLAPRNVNVTSPFLIGIIDIRWDNPAIYAENSGLQILGVNVYKSYNSPEGPYTQINTTPIGALYCRDQTQEIQITEDPMQGGRFIAGTTARGEWVAKTFHKPIIIPGTNGQIANNWAHVRVDVKETALDDFVTVPAFKVIGEQGEIYLISNQVYNHDTNRLDDPVLPQIDKGGEVRVTYTYINNWNQTDLFRKIYYKVTSVAFDNTCTGGTKETPLNEVEAFSLYDMEKIDWIWAEAIRRNSWILEQGGERVKLFIRKWSGYLCPCWDDQYRQARADHELCFAPGTPVRTIKGWEDIDKIKVGDFVLSSDGLYHRVIKNFERDFKGNLISIYPSVSTRPILSTPNHPYLVLRSNHYRKIGCGPNCDSFIQDGDGFNKFRPDVRLLPSGRWWARAQVGEKRGQGRNALGTFSTREEAEHAVYEYRIKTYKPAHIMQWDNAENISKKDWVTTQWFKEIQDITEIHVPDKYFKKSNYGPKRIGPTKFLVDEEFLWMIGMYLAEGSSGDRSIQFSLHKNEIVYQNKLIDIFNRYGYNPYLSKVNGLGVCVIVSSTILSEWFPEWLGHLCNKKHIPEEFMYLPKHKLWAIIQGIYDGDGSKREHEIGQTSEYLALQLVELLHRVGEQPLVRQQISKVLTPKGNVRKICYCVNWAEDSAIHNNRKGRWLFKRNALSKIKKISKVPYSGKVYNLEVDGDPTYIVNGIVTHNCYGTSYIGGYEGPYDIIIAPPESEKTVNLFDVGLHVNYNFATWTGPYPLLTDRDFIVRGNNDRFSIAHINAQGQRGAIFQQHFELSQLDQQDIRYKVPITGGEVNVPPSYNPYHIPAPTEASPVIDDKPTRPEQYQYKGRTVTFENIVM